MQRFLAAYSFIYIPAIPGPVKDRAFSILTTILKEGFFTSRAAGIPDVTMIYGYLTGPGVDHGGHAWNTYTDGKKTYMIDIVNFHCLEETIKDCDYKPNAINPITFRYTF